MCLCHKSNLGFYLYYHTVVVAAMTGSIAANCLDPRLALSEVLVQMGLVLAD